jgi:predicted nucleic acid-binding protein
VTAFFDTNVLIYAFANDDAKRERAQETLAIGGVVSVQVVNEFASVLRKKQRHEWPRIEAALAVAEKWFESIRPLTLNTHHAALALAREDGIDIHDALIVAAAREAGCEMLYSEDLQHGRRFGDLLVVNPFREPAS